MKFCTFNRTHLNLRRDMKRKGRLKFNYLVVSSDSPKWEGAFHNSITCLAIPEFQQNKTYGPRENYSTWFLQ